MRPQPDAPGESIPTEPETPRTNPDLPAIEQSQGIKPYWGGYYWLPTPSPNGITWSIVTCRYLGCDADAGHDAELWPRLMVPLASAWSKDAQILNRRLALSYTGLPRGRVTRPDKTFLVLHGKDSPVHGFEEMVVVSFRLTGRKVKFIYDEHETQLPGHSRALEASLDLRLYGAGAGSRKPPIDRKSSPTRGSMPNRIFAIGDIHGCNLALKSLIEAIAPQSDDTIITLGDYVDYGPDSRSVIDQLIQLSQRCRLIPILGNHEEMLLQALESDSALRSWLDLGGDQTLLSYPYDGTNIIDPAHVSFIRGCLDYFETDDFIFAHANYDPDLPMDRQPSLKLRWEFIDEPRQRPHFSGRTVIVGHTPQTSGEVLNLDFLRCIDTDSSRGGWLTGLEVMSGKVIQANQIGETRLDGLRQIAARWS